MILECTECHTRYLVPDTAIGRDGRTVRCANCKHSWFQHGSDPDEAAAITAPVPVQPSPTAPAPPLGETMAVAQASAAPASVSPGSTPSGQASPGSPASAPGYGDFDAFAHTPPFRGRRNPAKRWTIAALAAGIAMLAAVGGVAYLGAPGLASELFQPTTGTPLEIVSKPVDKHIFNGNEIFAVSGTVLNPTDSPQRIPDIRADLRDAQRRIVFSWMIRPEATMLPPKGKLEFNSAKLDVPVNAKELVLSFSGETAR